MERLFTITTDNAILWSQRGWGDYIKANTPKDSIEIVDSVSTRENATQDMAPLIKYFKDNKPKSCVLNSSSSW